MTTVSVVSFWRALPLLVLALLTMVLAERWGQALLHVLYPFFLLLYFRQQPPLRALLVATAAMSVVWCTAMSDFAPWIDALTWAIIITMGSLQTLLAYLADRLLHHRLPQLLATLVFPCAMVSMDFFRHLSDPYGSYGMLGYGLSADHPLAQWLVTTGVDGLSFLLAWGASVAASVYLQRQQWPRSRPLLLIYGSVLAAAWCVGLLLGQWSPSATETVRVATIAQRHATMASKQVIADQQQTLQRWLHMTRQQARDGAQLIVWGEGALAISSEFEPVAISAGQQLAAEEHIDLVMAVFHMDRAFNDKRHNKLIWIDKRGNVRQVYHKNHGQMVEQTINGEGRIGFIDTEWGKFALSICWDADFPRFMRQVGAEGAVALLNPSNDYQAVARGRANMARMRAIENGVALIRPNNNGINLLTDARGKVLASQITNSNSEVVLSIELPLQKRVTFYPWLADGISIASVMGLFAALVYAWRRRRVVSPVSAASPESAN